jgi:hypothetical protein
MGDDKDARVPGNDTLAQSIAKETGITEDQARAYSFDRGRPQLSPS